MNQPVILDNAAWEAVTPEISILVPFYKDDPRRLIDALNGEAPKLTGRIELIILEDGKSDPDLSQQIRQTILDLALPTRLIQLGLNEGRAKGRNRLTAAARGRYFLFLDSDMAPDRIDFLDVYLKLLSSSPDVVVGGFSTKQCIPEPHHQLHLALAARADCLPADSRSLNPKKYVFTSNLLVRREVFEAETFDETFKGWGWEDVEWGARVGSRFHVRHIDNPATHLGLDTAETLASKYEQSVANFSRLVTRHPELVASFPSYKLARFLKRLPARLHWRFVLKRLALNSGAPLLVRVFALKTYRAALYAEVVS